MSFVTYKTSTHVELTDAVVNMTNDVDMHNRSFWNQPGFCKVTPGQQLNRAIAIIVDFVNNKDEDPKSGRTIFHNTRKVVTLAQRRKQKGRFISIMSHHLMIETKDQSSHRKQSSGKLFGTTRNEAYECSTRTIEWSRRKPMSLP
jgi:hypothetical protein